MTRVLYITKTALAMALFGLVVIFAVGAVAAGVVAFSTWRELQATRAALVSAQKRADTADRALLQCDARRSQFEELLGLTAWRKKHPGGIGPIEGDE